MNRKEFLVTSSLAGLSLATRAMSHPFSNKDKINIGIIGCGARGQSHIEELCKRSDVAIVALADPDTQWAIPESQKILTRNQRTPANVF